LPFVSFHLHDRARLPLLPLTTKSLVPATLRRPITSALTANRSLTHCPDRTNMARYVVIVTAGDRTASLLVILSPSQLCSALVDAVKARLASITSKLNLPISDNLTITLHLENTDGPILDPEDLLSDVLPDVNEVCCAVIEVSRNNQNFAPPEDSMSTRFSPCALKTYTMPQ
jgi:hypothetical protein